LTSGKVEKIIGREPVVKTDKPPRPTEGAKKIDIHLFNKLRSITHDEDGNPREGVSAGAVNALNKTAKVYGKEIVRIQIPAIKKKGLGIDLLKRDEPPKDIYLVVDKGQDPDPQELIDILVSDYGYTEKDARELIR
jgi:hypothetical protein